MIDTPQVQPYLPFRGKGRLEILYTLRIYQRSSAENVIGTVELVDKRCEKTFHTMDELISILSSPRLRRAARNAAAPHTVKGSQLKGGLS